MIPSAAECKAFHSLIAAVATSRSSAKSEGDAIRTRYVWAANGMGTFETATSIQAVVIKKSAEFVFHEEMGSPFFSQPVDKESVNSA
jgi:hypothetical protein